MTISTVVDKWNAPIYMNKSSDDLGKEIEQNSSRIKWQGIQGFIVTVWPNISNIPLTFKVFHYQNAKWRSAPDKHYGVPFNNFDWSWSNCFVLIIVFIYLFCFIFCHDYSYILAIHIISSITFLSVSCAGKLQLGYFLHFAATVPNINSNYN